MIHIGLGISKLPPTFQFELPVLHTS